MLEFIIPIIIVGACFVALILWMMNDIKVKKRLEALERRDE